MLAIPSLLARHNFLMGWWYKIRLPVCAREGPYTSQNRNYQLTTGNIHAKPGETAFGNLSCLFSVNQLEGKYERAG